MKKQFRISDCGFRIQRIQGQGKNLNPQSAIRNPKLRGFTLIELMVVIVVLGIMMTLIIPQLGNIGDANLKRSARHLTGMIRFLRDESQAKKTVYRLRFDIQGGKYWAEEWTRLSDDTAEFKPLRSALANEGSLAGQTSFKDVQVGSHPDDPYIIFTPNGWVEPAFIHLRNGDDKPFTLIVNPLTGNTDLHEGNLEAQQR
jgi:general secretion pathway protein H